MSRTALRPTPVASHAPFARRAVNETPIGIALSGGVDSTATALLLGREHRLRGYLMNIGQPGFASQQEQVAELARRLAIELRVIDLRHDFSRLVLDYFSATYRAGMTPNPCMVCNRMVKFGLFLDRIRHDGCTAMATGHYARTTRINGQIALLRGLDETKDQSYFLARLRPEQLEQVRFPLGAMTKEETYRLVEQHGFQGFRGNESQDVCFLEKTTIAEYLAATTAQPARPGPIVTTAGERIGRHHGLLHYTIGQRRGIGLPDESPWYVTAIAPTTNTLVVGKADDLLQTRLLARRANWLSDVPPREGQRFLVRIRSTHRGSTAVVEDLDGDSFALRFNEPQRAVAPGQFAVLYDGERVVGSGEICPREQLHPAPTQ